MRFSIIIPTYTETEHLKRCVESVLKYTDLTDGELIVVANGAPEETKEFLKNTNVKSVLDDKPLGYAKAVNLGIDNSCGQYIVLLNDDAILLDQPKNQWIDMLLEPFKDDKVGASGPLKGFSAPANHDFLVFFLACISRKALDSIGGKLSEEFGVGGGEDTSACIEIEKNGFKSVQVPNDNKLGYSNGLCIGSFPVYHKGEASVSKNPQWQQIFDENSRKLAEKYNHQWLLGNSFERAVISATDDLKQFKREYTRYRWASENLIGTKVLEIGCSSGYGTRILPSTIDYTGIDYDKKIVEYAKTQFPDKKFMQMDITTDRFIEFLKSYQFDTIIAFEVLEHVDNGRELAQELKKYCKCLLATCPAFEKIGVWGKWHKLHELTEKDFPDFDYKYISEDGKIMYEPERFDGLNLLLLKWVKDMS